MTKAKKKSNPEISAEKQFFEIVNWRRAQSRMKAGPNDWLKLYTSLLEHDGFCGMDDSARMLIVALWLYAARSGKHVFPADPKWLALKIPMLNSKPDLRPLLNTTDIYSKPTPFIAYCKPPADSEAGTVKSDDPANKAPSAAGKTKKKKKKIVGLVEEKRIEETRRETRREEKRREKKREEKTKSLRISEEKKREEKTKNLQNSEEKKRERKEQIRTASASQTKAAEPEKPENPIDSEAGSAERHIVPKPARSVIRHSSPQSIGSILGKRFPDHWQDSDAESFGWEIVKALGYSEDRYNLKSRSEWGAFASWWFKVKQAAPAIVLEELRAKAINKANYIRTKGKSAKNPSKVWFHIMNSELSQRGVTITQPARASPG